MGGWGGGTETPEGFAYFANFLNIRVVVLR